MSQLFSDAEIAEKRRIHEARILAITSMPSAPDLTVHIGATARPLRIPRTFRCPTCGAPHLREVHLPPAPSRQRPFLEGLLVGLILAGAAWFALTMTWVGPR